ncbi:MAG: hypothetical protein J6Y66_04365 [Bacteroidales bacterium]|nr:hypothetical protein [Bacteroidales bacterium]
MKKTAILTIMAMAIGTGALAQNAANPAETASLDGGFLRIGEFQSTVRNNIGAASFLFPAGDKLVTGLHSSIPDDTFLGGLKPVNSYYGQVDYNLVSYGWKSRGFHTVDIGVRSNYGLSVPKEIFQILKTGTAQSPYDLSSLKAFGNLYAEVAYGYSLALGDKLSLGGRVKLLAGLNSVDITTRNLSLTTTEDQYTLALDADIDLTNRNKKVGADDGGNLDYTNFSGKGKLGTPTGAGLALDLGVVWKPVHGLSVSASVLDLGGILWYYGNAGVSDGSYTFSGLKELSTDEMEEGEMASKIKAVGEELLGAIRPKDAGGVFRLKGIPVNANMKLSYALPFWENLSVNASGMYTGYSFCAPYWEARGGLAVDLPGIAHVGINVGGGACGMVYAADSSVEFLSFKLYARYQNGTGGVIPYEDIPLKANNKVLSLGLIYKL